MKRILALFLPVAMVCALLVPVAMAENGFEDPPIIVVDPDPAESPPSPAGTDSSPVIVAPDEEGCLPPSQETVSPPTSVGSQTGAGGQSHTGGQSSTGSRPGTTRPSSGSNASSYINFSDLRALLNRYNSNMKALNAGIDAAENADLSALQDSIGQMDDMAANIRRTIADLTYAANDAALPEDIANVYETLISFLETMEGMIYAQKASLESQLASTELTLETTKNTLNDSVNQLVKGAETLYVAIITMESAKEDIVRGIESLDRAVALTEKQVELGMASPYDAESMRHQRATVQSQLEGLEYQITTTKITLEGMLGMPLRGTVSLNPVTLPSAAELAAVNYDAQLNSAMRRNVDVKNAALKDDGSDSSTYSYQGAKDTFAYKFKLICLAVPEQQRLVQAAQETLEFQQRTLSIAARKYQLGMLSHEEYLAAENEVKSAGSSLFTAQLDLFTAYRNYVYASQYGIV